MQSAQFEAQTRLGAHLPLHGRRLEGRGAIVSGAGCEGDFLGVGAATAVLFAMQGAGVGVLDASAGRAANTVSLIEAMGGEAVALVCDVRDRTQCEAAVARQAEVYPPLSVLVNNAAVVRRGDVGSIEDGAWRETLAVTLDGTLNLTRAAAGALKASRGSVVNISSAAAALGHGAIAYAAAKGGLEAMTRDMAFSLGASGVRVNTVAPGRLSTPMTGRRPPSERAMLPTEGTAWDAAWAALFLAGEEARWITAETLRVDAGFAASGRPRPNE